MEKAVGLHEKKEREDFVSKNIVVKIGSSTITGGGAEVDMPFLQSIAEQVAVLRQSGTRVTIVSSGAVACGKRNVTGYDGSRLHKQMAASFGQANLIARWQEAFLPYGIGVAQILVTEETLSSAQVVIEQASQFGIVIINANDSVNSDEIDQLGICADNDRLAAHLAEQIRADTVLLLTDTAVKDVYGNEVSCINPYDDLSQFIQFNGSSSLGTGGMASKHMEALQLAQYGIRAHIGNGREPDALLNAARGSSFGTMYLQ
ncbi:hypothetical protein KBD81_05435 [Candidatus Woesebacteria bacterium]|nr:hypothetical protein [Candidatus Woesebacteria bacterium]